MRQPSQGPFKGTGSDNAQIGVTRACDGADGQVHAVLPAAQATSRDALIKPGRLPGVTEQVRVDGIRHDDRMWVASCGVSFGRVTHPRAHEHDEPRGPQKAPYADLL